jgi:hypothetical protein
MHIALRLYMLVVVDVKGVKNENIKGR